VSANAEPMRRWFLRARHAADPTIVNPARLSPARAADVCGRCHGQRLADDVAPFLTRGDPFVPGDDLALTTSPLWRDTPLAGDRTAFAPRFWADGTPRLTAYEYQGLLQSRCAQQGTLTCQSCHGMHEGEPRGQLRVGLRGADADRMCTRCHAAYAERGAAALHARHDAEGAGARCVGCHMPRVVYGVLDVHRSHRIELPDPARAARDGRPDACTGCHVTETPAWAAAARARLWGREAVPAGGRGPLDLAFAGDPVARAVAVDALGREQEPLAADARARRAGTLLDVMQGDAYPAVRHLAARAFDRLVADTSARSAYDPAAPAEARAAAVTSLRARFGAASARPSEELAALRALAPADAVDIGE
jgi:predicted CXXCH cytochrome family protein